MDTGIGTLIPTMPMLTLWQTRAGAALAQVLRATEENH
jgi:hypothetical protein